MENRPEISVIMPVRNAGRTVERAVSSVLGQSFENLELIAVDDGSEDDSGEILDRLAASDRRVRVIHGDGQGVSGARNRGIEASSGKLTAFADSDDVTKKDWLLSLKEGMETPGCGMAVCGYETLRGGEPSSKTEFERARLTPAEAMAAALRYRNITTAVWNKMFLSDILKSGNIRFRTEFQIGEDMVFLAEYLREIKSVEVVPGSPYLYNENPGGAMGSFGKGKAFRRSWISEWDAVKKTEEILREQGIVLRETDIKKVRIAGKLLPLLSEYRLDKPELKKELVSFLRRNMDIILKEPEFDRNRRIIMLLGAVSPEAASRIRRGIWRKQRQDR